MGQTGYSHDEATTAQRFEAKYYVSELEAEAIKDYMSPYVMADHNTKGGKPYIINSLYLDNDSLRLYWSSALGEKNRFKLRIRSYTEKPEDPVFFEIKRRIDRVILKQRAVMKRQSVDLLFQRRDVPKDHFLKPIPTEIKAFYDFRDTMESMKAGPCAMVRYTREAYMSNLEEPVRITFDRELTTLPCPEYEPGIWRFGPHWSTMDTVPVILEIKFTDTFPEWVKRMVHRFSLSRDSFAKYVVCLDGLKREGMPLTWMRDPDEDIMWSRVP
jgi:hypothetical protein